MTSLVATASLTIGLLAVGAVPAHADVAVTDAVITLQPASAASTLTATNGVLHFGVGSDARLDQVSLAGEALRMAASNPDVRVRRVGANCDGGPDRQSMWFGPYTTDAVTGALDVQPTYVDDMVTALADPYINQGMDNVFTNSCEAFTNTNIERLDILSDAFQVRDTARDGFMLMERGGNDPFKIAAVTAVDAQGNPTAYGATYSANSSGWGMVRDQANQNFAVTSAVVQVGAGVATITNRLASQNIGARFISAADLGIPVGATIYGVVIAGADAPASLADPSTFPKVDDTAAGGLDLIGAYLMTSRTRAIGQRVWLDTNGDGIQNAGEQGIDGIVVELVDTWGNVIDRVTTSDGGAYLFTDLTPAEYTVRIVGYDDYFLTFDEDSSTTSPDGSIVVPSGDASHLTADFGLQLRTPDVSIVKTVSGASGPGTPAIAVPGDILTYTLALSNTGTGAGAIEYYDNLSDVLEYASWTGISDDGGLTLEFVPDVLSLTGSIAAGSEATVSYQVTVGDDIPVEGENLVNRVTTTVPTGAPEVCEPGETTCTVTPIRAPQLEYGKSVESDTTPVAAGSVLTYTLWFDNPGDVPVAVDHVDELTHVLDDATLTGAPVSDTLDVTASASSLAITGSIEPGESAQVIYSVTIKEDGERGDDIAANYLLPNDPDNPPAPRAEPTCQPTEEEECTVTPIGRAISYKQVTADTDVVDAGTVLTYTLTFDNQGEGPVAIGSTDVLADVLDDAELTSAPTASDDALTVSAVAQERFSVTGILQPGQIVTVVYEVTVREASERGNDSIDNFLVPTGDPVPDACESGDGTCTVTPLPRLETEKAADPVSGTAVQAGQQVTYTLTFTNLGSGPAVVDHTDDLAGVLDDSDLVVAPAVDGTGLTVTDGEDGTVRITGTLAPDQVVRVTYTVQVTQDGERGDNRLDNVLAPTDEQNPECTDEGVHCTTHPIGELEAWKTVDPASGTAVQPGSVLTYTLHFENTGTGDVEFTRDDVLTGVLDDADVTSAPVVSRGTLVLEQLDAGRLRISGALAVGETATVTYAVTVKADGERGDDRIVNHLVPAGDPVPEVCAPGSNERAGCTVNDVSVLTVVKSSDPASGSKVAPGDEITYTITIANVSANPEAAAVSATYIDDLSEVLDDAVLSSGPVASDPSVDVQVSGDSLRISGAFASDSVVTVSYTVTVATYADLGDGVLRNVVAAEGAEPICAAGSQLCTVHDVVPQPVTGGGGALPSTGGTVPAIALVAGVLTLFAGAVLLARSRRQAARTR